MTSETCSVHGRSASVATAPPALMMSAPIECPTRAIRVTSVGQWSTRRCISAASATPFSRSDSPVFARRSTGVQPSAASASAYVVPTASRFLRQ